MTAGAHRAGANAFPPSTRTRLPFRAVNDPGRPGFDSGLQRHHLLPRQLLGLRAFAPLLDSLGHERIGLDCFRRNGLLQRALRRRLLDPRLRRFRLNRRDPQGKAHDFAELDAMVAMLWPETAV